MNGVLHSSQVNFEYCRSLIKEYSILDMAQIYTLMKINRQLNRRRRLYIAKNLFSGDIAIKIEKGDRSYLAKGPGFAPTGKHKAKIICFWVLLEYITKVDKHNAASTFIRIAMEIDGRDYGIVYVQKGQERLCNANIKSGGDIRYFVVVEDTAQIPLIRGDKIHTFATVSEEGKIEYYSME